MSRMSRACSIPRKVKTAVWERDGGCCILCGSPHASPNAHVVPRSRGGMGVERNIVTLCQECHTALDNGQNRKELYSRVVGYLKEIYPDWDEKELIYRRY